MPMPRARYPLIATVLLGSVPAAPSPAQIEGVIAERQPPAAPTDSKETNQGVYVRDSAVAAEKLALGERMERLKEWDKAADVFQEILEKYPDRVVQSTAPGRAYQYSSVALAVQQRLAKWPADGLRAYRNRYESNAAELLGTAATRDDYATLNSVYQRYFITDAGKSAGQRLVDLYLESGEFPAAAWLGDRLLQWHPTIAPDRPKLLYRVAVAYHLSGDKEKARARLAELQKEAPDATGTVRGQDVNLAESLARDLASPAAVAQNQSAESWPTFMGDPTRSRISTGLGRAGARPFSSIELGRPTYGNIPPEVRQEFENFEKLDRERGLNIGIIPAVDRGEMFFQDGARVYAVSLDSGSPLAGWAQTYPGVGRLETNAALGHMSRRQQYTVTVTDKELFAVTGQAGRSYVFPGQNAAQRGETRLLCLDRATGREKWSRSPKDFPDQGNVRSLGLGGSPLVVGDNVYVCGTGGKSQQFDDCYVFCLDRETGEHKWSAYVCSAATGQVLWGGDAGPAADTVASPAYASGRLYVLTNLGAVASLDAHSGSIVWLNTYERDAVEDPRMMRFGGAPSAASLPKPWAYNPAVVSGGHVFALPADGKHLNVYDAGSGDLLKRVNLADVDDADTLVGVRGDTVIVTADTNTYAFDWTKYDPANFGPRADPSYWRSPLPSKNPIRGRGFVTADSVFIPTKERLFRIGLASGKIEDPYPPFPRGAWEEPEGPGNVIVTEDKVVLAGPNRVSVYTDLAVARARLDHQVAASPNDPDLRLRYADMLFAAGDVKASMAKLDEAIAILGGEKNLTPGPSRDRAFQVALTFAQKLTDPKAFSADNKGAIDRLFDQAAAAAGSASQQVEYRVTRAKYAHAGKDYATEARLYQEILADEPMRAVTLGSADGNGARQAAALAEAAIDALVKRAGPQVYATYERTARDAMDFARSAGKPDDLLQIARRFPNASVASQSMFHAAEAYEAAGDHRRATQVLRQLYFKYPTAPNTAAVLEAMARNYLSIPGRVEVASARLAQGARLNPSARLTKPLPLPDGESLENVTFAQAADALKRIRSAVVTRSLPEFRLPAGKPPVKPFVRSAPIPDVAALVTPLREFPRNDRAVAYTTDGHVAVFAADGSPQPLWRSKTLDAAPRECAWLGGNLAVWNAQEVALLSGENGTPLWRSAVRSLPDIQVVKGDDAPAQPGQGNAADNGLPGGGNWVVINGRRVQLPRGGNVRIAGNVVFQGGAAVNVNAPPAPAPDPAAGEQVAQVRPAGDKLIASTTTGRLFAVELDTGRLAWQTRLAAGRPIERLLATDDFAVARFSEGPEIDVVALDAATGQAIRRYDFRVDANLPVNQALSPDGTLVIALADRLTAKDLYEPGPDNKWETPVQPNGPAFFVSSEHPDQLLARDGRVVVVSDSGAFVRVLSLDTGEPLRARTDAGESPVQLPTGARANTAVRLRLAGPSLYVFGPNSFKAFDLDNPLDTSGQRTLPDGANLRDLFVGSDYVIALDEPGVARFIGNPDGPAQSARLLAYSRARVNNRESGRLDFDPTISDTPNMTTWHPVTAGLFYLTADNRLHFLKSNAPQ
jgi:outer membrane protein assembly factor BamB/TolA-binding protein